MNDNNRQININLPNIRLTPIINRTLNFSINERPQVTSLTRGPIQNNLITIPSVVCFIFILLESSIQIKIINFFIL